MYIVIATAIRIVIEIGIKIDTENKTLIIIATGSSIELNIVTIGRVEWEY